VSHQKSTSKGGTKNTTVWCRLLQTAKRVIEERYFERCAFFFFSLSFWIFFSVFWFSSAMSDVKSRAQPNKTLATKFPLLLTNQSHTQIWDYLILHWSIPHPTKFNRKIKGIAFGFATNLLHIILHRFNLIRYVN